MADTDFRFSVVLIGLMKGVVWREEDGATWEALDSLQTRVRDHVALLGLELILDEAEGYAYLRQRPDGADGDELPRLVPRRQLSYYVSLLLALLRRRLAEFEARDAETRLVLTREDLIDLIRDFFGNASNEVKLQHRIDTAIEKVAKLGFLRALKGEGERYEVRRVLKAFVDAQWLEQLDTKLAEYRAHALGAEREEGA
jgi:hypothetical protein